MVDPLDSTPTVFVPPANNNHNNSNHNNSNHNNNNRETIPTEFDESMLLSPKIEIFDNELCMETNRQGHNQDIQMDNANNRTKNFSSKIYRKRVSYVL